MLLTFLRARGVAGNLMMGLHKRLPGEAAYHESAETITSVAMALEQLPSRLFWVRRLRYRMTLRQVPFSQFEGTAAEQKVLRQILWKADWVSRFYVAFLAWFILYPNLIVAYMAVFQRMTPLFLWERDERTGKWIAIPHLFKEDVVVFPTPLQEGMGKSEEEPTVILRGDHFSKVADSELSRRERALACVGALDSEGRLRLGGDPVEQIISAANREESYVYIDGPSGTGKSTLLREAAKRMPYSILVQVNSDPGNTNDYTLTALGRQLGLVGLQVHYLLGALTLLGMKPTLCVDVDCAVQKDAQFRIQLCNWVVQDQLCKAILTTSAAHGPTLGMLTHDKRATVFTTSEWNRSKSALPQLGGAIPIFSSEPLKEGEPTFASSLMTYVEEVKAARYLPFNYASLRDFKVLAPFVSAPKPTSSAVGAPASASNTADSILQRLPLSEGWPAVVKALDQMEKEQLHNDITDAFSKCHNRKAMVDLIASPAGITKADILEHCGKEVFPTSEHFMAKTRSFLHPAYGTFRYTAAYEGVRRASAEVLASWRDATPLQQPAAPLATAMEVVSKTTIEPVSSLPPSALPHKVSEVVEELDDFAVKMALRNIRGQVNIATGVLVEETSAFEM